MKEVLNRVQSYKNIIWDWNGTLLNDYAVNKKVIFSQLKEYGLSTPTNKEFKEIFCFPIKQFYQRLGFCVNESEFKQLAKRFMESYRKLVVECDLHRGSANILRQLYLKQKKQYVLSASEQMYLKEQVMTYNISQFFEKVLGHSNIYGESKVELGKLLMKDEDLVKSDTILIGDTDHDYEVACALGIDSLLIAGGNHSYDKLKKIHYNVLRLC